MKTARQVSHVGKVVRVGAVMARGEAGWVGDWHGVVGKLPAYYITPSILYDHKIYPSTFSYYHGTVSLHQDIFTTDVVLNTLGYPTLASENALLFFQGTILYTIPHCSVVCIYFSSFSVQVEVCKHREECSHTLDADNFHRQHCH